MEKKLKLREALDCHASKGWHPWTPHQVWDDKKLNFFVVSFFVLSLFSHSLFSLNHDSAPNFRLVVTGGLQGIHPGHKSFYNSPIFKLGPKSPVLIKNAIFQGFVFEETAFFSLNPIKPEDLIEAGKMAYVRTKVATLNASQLYAVQLTKNSLKNFENSYLARELGGILKKTQAQVVLVKGKPVYAVDFSVGQSGVKWPTHLDKIGFINLVHGTNQEGEDILFFPRDFRSTSRTFELVDALLAKKQGSPVRYVDLGNALTRPDYEDPNMATEMSRRLQERSPAALALGRYDLGTVSTIPQKSPYIAAFKGPGAPEISRRVRIGSQEVRFLALGDISDLAGGFLSRNLVPLTVAESIKSLKLQKEDLVIALAENRNAAAEAIEYPALDLVLSLFSTRGGSLPAEDEITLGGNEAVGVRPVAPLVRISSADVTEVSVWVGEYGQIRKIKVQRHPIVGGLVTQRNFYPAVLPKKKWTQKDFQEIFSNILLNSFPSAELVVFEKRLPLTPVDSALPMPLAVNLITPAGRAAEITLGGAFLKRLLKAIKGKQLDLDLEVKNTLHRPISDAENYRVVTTEQALSVVTDFITQENLFVIASNPASSLETALLESNKDALKILAQLRKRESRVALAKDDRYELLKNSPSLSQLVTEALFQKDAFKKRPKRSVLIFDISDLDVGFKANVINDTLSEWQSEAGGNSKAAFDEGRFWEPRRLNVLLHAKMGLYYLMPKLEFGLVSSVKYFQPNTEGDNPTKKDIQKIRPVKDSVKVEAEVLIPISWYLSPLFRLSYETQLWPNTLFTNLPKEDWPRRVNDMRLFMGGSSKPWLGYELIRAGALFAYDFSRDSANQSFGYGFELGSSYQHNWKRLGFKIETNFRKLFPIVKDPDLGRMGIVWLTDLKVSIPIVAGFSAAALTNITIGQRMDLPSNLGVGAVFGVALSYGRLLKWLT